MWEEALDDIELESRPKKSLFNSVVNYINLISVYAKDFNQIIFSVFRYGYYAISLFFAHRRRYFQVLSLQRGK